MPMINYAEVKRQITLRMVLSALGYRYPLVRWPRCKGPCPLGCSHNNRAASFDLKDGKWHCFACKKGGNQLDLYVTVRGLQLHPATVELCERLGIELPTLEAYMDGLRAAGLKRGSEPAGREDE